MRAIDAAFEMHDGYVLDFSNRTMLEFFEDEFGIDIYSERYAYKGESKAKHLRAFIEVENGVLVSKVLRQLWIYRNSIPLNNIDDEATLRKESRLFEVLERIESSEISPQTEQLSHQSDILDFDTVSRDLKRALKIHIPILKVLLRLLAQ